MADYWTARTAIKTLDEGWGLSTWEPTQMVIRGKKIFKAKGTMPNTDLSDVDYFFIDTADKTKCRKYEPSNEDQDATTWVRRYPAS